MNTTVSHNPEACQQRVQRLLRVHLRRGLALIGAIGLGSFLMASLALALNNYQAFHATGEQVNLGISVSGSYTDTYTADGTYRVAKEQYVNGEARTFSDNPSDFTFRDTYTGIINYTPYTMPAEGGFIYRMAIYIFEAGDTQVRLALYENIENEPRLLLAQSDPLSATSTGWLWFDIEPQLVPGGTRYWIAYQANNNEAKLGWRGLLPPYPNPDGYRFSSGDWGPFPSLVSQVSDPVDFRTCYQIAYTATQYALDVTYTIPVTPMLDAYTLTVRGATSGEPFSVTADGQAVGIISYAPSTRDFFSDDMESGVGGWTADGFMHIITDSSYYSSPTHVWWTDDVPYGSSASLTSIPITLPFNARDMELRFWHRMVAEFNWDGGWVEYRIQNENGTWPVWSAVTDTMLIHGAYNAVLEHIPSAPHVAWTWTITDVVRVQIPVTAAGRSIQWRWIFECDTIGTEPIEQPNGWWIDDVRVLGTASDDTDLVFSVPLSAASDGQVNVRFQDTITNSYPDLLGVDLIEISGVLYNRAPAVTVTMPSGGEYWRGTRTIEWSGSDINGDVITYNVYLSTDGGGTWSSSLYEVIYSESGTPVTHSWDGFDTTAFADSDNCLIRIQASDSDASASDQSDAALTIDNTAPSVTLTAPSGGEMLQGGTTYEITWTASDDNFGPQPIALRYSTNGGLTFPNVITSSTESDGSFTWNVPSIDNTTVQVQVVATDLADHSGHDESANFTVDSTAPSVTLTAPSGGEVLQGGATYEITWTASDDNLGPQPITLRYSTDGGLTFPNVTTSSTENDGSFTWNVPSIDNTTVQVQVVATDLAGHSSHDESANFTVDSTDPSVILTAPSGGEVLEGGATYEITWTASDANFGSTPIALYYSTDGGTSFPYTITSGTANDGSFTWSVPSIDNATVRVRVVATDLAGNSSQDESANFTVDSTAPSVTLTAPSSGEVLQGGATYEITWTASDDNFGFQPITLRYSTDGGLTFPNVITTATENDGSYTWTVPTLDNSSVQVRVVATDLASNSGQDDSNNFTVDSTPPNGTVTITEGGQTTSRDIHLALDAPADTVEMYLNGDIVDASNARQWIAYTTTTTVTLTEGEGSKTVTVQYRDWAGNEGDLASDEVLLALAPEPFRVYLPIVMSAH